jgi:4-hydroxybenzoate polyprenyltransferase
LKEAVASAVKPDSSVFVYREQVLELVRHAKAEGRAVHLVTAADQSTANAIALHLQCFDSVKGSDGKVNLRGRNKLSWLRKHFPEGFIYAGHNAADLPVWEAAKAAILIGDGVAHAERLRDAGIAVATVTEEKTSVLHDWLSELRLHQWTKNLLIFVPLFLGHIAGDLQAVARTVAAFFAFGLVASATYLINDLADLAADRLHPTKRFRAVAAGRIPVAQPAFASVVMVFMGLVAGFALKPAFAGVMGAYLLLTLAYSFHLKRTPMVDVAAIGALFTLRVVMGTVLNDLALSPWLISFSAYFFFSLSLAKRHVEVMRASSRNLEMVRGRGYLSADWPLTLGFGISAALASIIIMLLFVAESAAQSGVYTAPQWLYVAPACVFLWVQRIWLLSHRMELEDDPVVFALKDPQSYFLGAIIAVAFVLAL